VCLRSHTGFVAHPAYGAVGARVVSQYVKWPWCGTDYYPVPNALIKKVWILTTPLFCTSSWCGAYTQRKVTPL
jgi:hypothetical protein